jgi:glycosyltransferase involved in cell wall biosynthesis
MPERPTFSVVIPCYNYGHYLTDTLESVFAQDRDDVEILLVDDASTDDTPDIAKRFDGRLHYIRNERNLGAGGAWRLGLGHARGDFVMKLDADDALLPGCFDAVDNAFRLDSTIGAVICSVIVNKEHEGTTELQLVSPADQTLTAIELRSRLLHSFFFRMPGCILRAAILEGHEPPDPELYQIHDWEYFLRVTRGHKARLLHQPAAVYRVHDKSITATAQLDNRLYNDIRRWLEIAQQPGDRHIETAELHQLRGSCADLMLIGFGPKLDPRSYVRYTSKYFKALQISSGGGLRQVLRVHLGLLNRIFRKLGRFGKAGILQRTSARWLRH